MPFSWMRSLIRTLTPRQFRLISDYRNSVKRKSLRTFRPTLEALELRIVPTFLQAALLAPPNITAVGDFNGDGLTDIVTVTATTPSRPPRATRLARLPPPRCW
jgi:hypothetical protein